MQAILGRMPIVLRSCKDGKGPALPGGASEPGRAAPHVSTGQATELGNHTGAGFFNILVFTSPLTAEFSSAPTYVFTAANGDKLAVTYGDVNNGAASPGEVTLTPNSDGSFIAEFVAEFNPVPSQCTGRFAKVTGGGWITNGVGHTSPKTRSPSHSVCCVVGVPVVPRLPDKAKKARKAKRSEHAGYRLRVR